MLAYPPVLAGCCAYVFFEDALEGALGNIQLLQYPRQDIRFMILHHLVGGISNDIALTFVVRGTAKEEIAKYPGLLFTICCSQQLEV